MLAHGAICALPDQIDHLRRNPGIWRGQPFPPALLRHADEQTIAGLAAVLQAIGKHRLEPTDFARWGILGSPRFLGRATLVKTIAGFHAEGAWGVSPHIVPHRLLHALSGTLSQLLGLHGPNHGVGGGPGGIQEAILTALTLLNTEQLPGLWLVLTAHVPEPVLDDRGEHLAPAPCHALALALRRAHEHHEGPRLRFVPSVDEEGSEPSIESLCGALDKMNRGNLAVSWAGRCGTIELHHPGSDDSNSTWSSDAAPKVGWSATASAAATGGAA